METYGKLGTKALRLLRTLGQDLADSNQPSALRPWHARSFMDSAVQHAGAAPAGAYSYRCCRYLYMRSGRNFNRPAVTVGA